MLTAGSLVSAADHAGSVRPRQQPRRPDAAEARRHDGAEQEGYTGKHVIDACRQNTSEEDFNEGQSLNRGGNWSFIINAI